MRTRNKFSVGDSIISSFLYTPLLAFSLNIPVLAQLSDSATDTPSTETPMRCDHPYTSRFTSSFTPIDISPDLAPFEKIDFKNIPAKSWQANYKEAQSCFAKGEFGKAAVWSAHATKAAAKTAIKQLADSKKLYADSLFALTQSTGGNIDGFNFNLTDTNKKTVQAYKDCLSNNVSAYGKNSDQVAEIYTGLALSFSSGFSGANTSQILNWALQAVQINTKLHGPTSKQTKQALSNQAVCLVACPEHQSQNEKSRTIINNLINTGKKEANPDHAFLGRMYMNLGQIVNAGVITSPEAADKQTQNKYQLAKAEFQAANDPIGLFYSNYAMMRNPSGTADPAIFETQWKLAQQIFPATNSLRMNALMQYAQALAEHRQYKQLEQVLLLAKTQFAPNDPLSLANQSEIDTMLIAIYNLTKEPNKIEPLVLARLKTALKTDKSLPNKKPREWKLVKAEKLQLQGATNGTIGPQRPSLPTIIEAQELAGDFYASIGDFAKAETYYRQCLDNCLRSNCNPNFEDWFWYWVNPYANKLANCLLAQDKPVEASKYLSKDDHWSSFQKPPLLMSGNSPSHSEFSFVVFTNPLKFPANGFRTDVKLATMPSATELKTQADQAYEKKDYYNAYLLYRECCIQAPSICKDNAALYDLYKKTLISLIYNTNTDNTEILDHGEEWAGIKVDEIADQAQKAAAAQWGPESSQAIDALELKALADYTLKAYSDVPPLLTKVVALREKNQPNSEALAKSLINLGRAIIISDSFNQNNASQEFFEKAEAILSKLNNVDYLQYMLLGDRISTAKITVRGDTPPSDVEVQKENEQIEKLLREHWLLSDKLFKQGHSLWDAEAYSSHLFHTGKQAEAIKFLTELNSQLNDTNDSNGGLRSRICRALAECYASQYDYKNAESQLKTALDFSIKANPNWQAKPKIQWSMAELRAILPKPEETIIYGVNTAGSLDQPYHISDSASKLASLYYQQGDLDNAKKYFEMALEADERSGGSIKLLPVALDNLAAVLLKQNKPEEAKKYLIYPDVKPHGPFPVSVGGYGYGTSNRLLIPGEPVVPPADIANSNAKGS